MKPKINEYLTCVIKRTHEPTAPFILQGAGESSSKVGRLLAPLANEAFTKELQERLLKEFAEEDPIFHSTEFVVALAGLFHQALVQWTNRTVELDRKGAHE
jgi:hypothetical protein